MRVIHIFLLVLLGISGTAQDGRLLRVTRSLITFESDAPLEFISASNTRSTGLIDPGKRTFAVQVPVVEFEGFNSPLQQEHFKENYMETGIWPNASIQGRIIEAVDLSIHGSYSVRAKGLIKIHGVERERIIPCEVTVAGSGVRVVSTFEVALEDHGIRVPRVVQQKIASVIQVRVDLLFKDESTSQ